MLNIILRFIKDRKISLIIYCLASVGFTWMYVGMYPSIAENSAQFEEAFANYPTEMFEAMGVEDLSLDTLEKFLGMENYSIIFPIMLLSFLLSFSASTIFSALPLAAAYDIDYFAKGYVVVFCLSLLFGWAIFSIGYMFSAFFSDKGKVYMFSGSLVLLMYVANIISALMEKLENIQYLSFFYYYDYNSALQKAAIDWLPIVVFVGVAVICTAIGAWYYHRRDIAI